jgi:hypothetical protein
METKPESDIKMPHWALPVFSWLVSFYFLAGFVVDVGFPPKPEIKPGQIVYFLAWLFFLFLTVF